KTARKSLASRAASDPDYEESGAAFDISRPHPGHRRAIAGNLREGFFRLGEFALMNLSDADAGQNLVAVHSALVERELEHLFGLRVVPDRQVDVACVEGRLTIGRRCRLAFVIRRQFGFRTGAAVDDTLALRVERIVRLKGTLLDTGRQHFAGFARQNARIERGDVRLELGALAEA